MAQLTKQPHEQPATLQISRLELLGDPQSASGSHAIAAVYRPLMGDADARYFVDNLKSAVIQLVTSPNSVIQAVVTNGLEYFFVTSINEQHTLIYS